MNIKEQCLILWSLANFNINCKTYFDILKNMTPKLTYIMPKCELANGSKNRPPEYGAGLCLEQATTVKTYPLISVLHAQPPSFSENLGHSFSSSVCSLVSVVC